LDKSPVRVADSPSDQHVLKEAKPVAVSELTAGAGFQYADAVQQKGIRSALVVPLNVSDSNVGVLRLYSGQVREFSPEETSVAVAMAELGAVAIENARRHGFRQAAQARVTNDASAPLADRSAVSE
jgi:GAF domain-containing protein